MYVLSPQLCADTNLTNMQRQLALEVIVTLSETAAAMLRKHTALVAQSGEDLVYNLVEGILITISNLTKSACLISASDAGDDGGP